MLIMTDYKNLCIKIESLQTKDISWTPEATHWPFETAETWPTILIKIVEKSISL